LPSRPRKCGQFSDHTQRQAARLSNVSKTRIAQAEAVLQFAPDLADSVLAGAMPLDAAYQTATRRKQDSMGTESQLQRLREAAPDLADLVTEERLMLAGARAEADERGRGKVDPAGKDAETAGFSLRRVQEARQVLHSSPDLSDSVLAGAAAKMRPVSGQSLRQVAALSNSRAR
jgi:hypothetical protein